MRNAARVLALLVVFGAAAFWWFKPSYLVVDIPVARHQGGGDFWWETERSELAYADSQGVLYLRRQVGTAYPETHWRTREEAFAFFDKALSERGWISGARGIYDPVVPESRLLESENVKIYRRPEQSRTSTSMLQSGRSAATR